MIIKECKILFLSIGLVISSMLFYSCTNNYEEILEGIDYENYPEQSAENIEIIRTDSGKIRVKIFAPVLERYSNDENPYNEFVKGIKVVTYTNYPISSSSLTCEYARQDVAKELWEARDNVVAVNADGDTIKTEQMFWDLKTKMIYSDKYVNIRSGNEIIHGSGFTAQQDFSNWKITNGKGIIYLDE